MGMRIDRQFAMADARTFQIPPVAKLLKEEVPDGLVCEPFPYQSKQDCFEYMSEWDPETADCVLLDPPYTNRQVSEHYKELGIKVTGWHTSRAWTSKVKREAARILKPGGTAISFGYNTGGLGRKNGMRIYRILIVNHGADHYDLLVTCERKVQGALQ